MSVVAIDCEMVGSGIRNLLARVSIVDRKGSILLNEFVRPTEVVTDYRTSVSGITERDLANGRQFSYVHSQVSNKLRGIQVLVGHSLQNDLDALGLGLSFPESNRFDLAKYEPFMKNGQPQSLKDLARIYLKKTIQQGPHSSVEDAQTAMQLYNLVANQ